MNDSERNIRDEGYKISLEEARWRYTTHGLNANKNAYEYGLLTVKNAFLVAGGGLIFIPTMAGISDKIKLDDAFWAGFCFGIAVLQALIRNYLIHLNWLKHGKVWADIFEIEKIYIRRSFAKALTTDEADMVKLERSQVNAGKWIFLTFWIPHVLVVVYLVSLACGFYFLYRSFDLIWQGT